jgi:hypothetical protein
MTPTVATAPERAEEAEPSPNNAAITLPNSTNAVRFRLYTSAAPRAAHLFNTFAIDAYGETLLDSLPSGWPNGASNRSASLLHNLLVNGEGPQLALTNGMTVIEAASAPGWQYLALDASPAYRGQLDQFQRAVLYIEPDLIILHDHIVAQEPVDFKMVLHPPTGTRVDPIWGDLRFEGSHAAFRIHAPAGPGKLRQWQRLESDADRLFPGTVTMQLGPTNKVSQLDLVTIFALSRKGANTEFAFKLLEGNGAIAARIHRAGLPTLVAFRTDLAVERPSVTGFTFHGPVGVDIYKPKAKRR